MNNIKINNNNNILKDDIFYVMRCSACSLIPLIRIKYSQINIFQNKDIFLANHNEFAKVQCLCIKGHNITTSLKTYLIYSKIKHNFFTLCEQCHESKSSELFDFSFCKECKETLCMECSKNHNHKKLNSNNLIDSPKKEGSNPNNIENKNSKDNSIISICELEFNCQFHKKELNLFCKDCNINLCNECEVNHNKEHKMIYFNNIKLNEEEIKNIEFNIDLAKKRLFLFENKILKFIHSLYQLEKLHQQLLNLYNFFISIYKDQISFAESTLLIYKDAVSKNKYNFQIIQNTRNLKFNIRGIPIKNTYDFTTNIKSLTSYLSNSKNFLLLDVKNYYSNKKIIKARIRAAAKRIRSKIYLNNLKINNNESNNKKDNSDNKLNGDIEENKIDKEIKNNLNDNNQIIKGEDMKVNNI